MAHKKKTSPKARSAKSAGSKKKASSGARRSPAVSKAKSSLTKVDFDFYKELLLNMRAKIVGDLKHLESDSLNKSTEEMTGDHADVIDTAQDEFEREFVLNLASNEQQILNKIDVALRKIADGTYGVCEKYGTPIPKKRLLAMPYTTLSLRAQEEQEKGL